ncbi:MAG: thioredoxin family protein [Candidatus Aenigmatarchaeota archaeon]
MRVEYIVFGVIIVGVIVLSLFNFGGGGSNYTNQGTAPDLVGISGWINTEPLSLDQLRGKVVLIDFWTYSCINCIRTLPHLKGWHERYSDDGLVIIGVHTPEFEFEKDYNNVKAAVENYGLEYAIAQDNDYATWQAYGNRYWPRKYILDAQGNIRYDHIGEGGYEETERVIQDLLKEANYQINETIGSSDSGPGLRPIGFTPELYFGYNFARAPLGNPEGLSPGGTVDYQKIDVTQPNIIYLEGQWTNGPDGMTAVGNGKVFLRYTAKSVNIVAGGSGNAKILADGNVLSETNVGTDVNQDSSIDVTGRKLYNIVSTVNYESHLLEIQAEDGFEIYTFTFG